MWNIIFILSILSIFLIPFFISKRIYSILKIKNKNALLLSFGSYILILILILILLIFLVDNHYILVR